jgi:hypothetical protein
VQQQQQPQHHHASPPYGAAKGKTHQGTAVTVQLPEENQPALVCYFPAGHPPADASFTLYEHTVGSHASKRQRAAFTLVGTKVNPAPFPGSALQGTAHCSHSMQSSRHCICIPVSPLNKCRGTSHIWDVVRAMTTSQGHSLAGTADSQARCCTCVMFILLPR